MNLGFGFRFGSKKGAVSAVPSVPSFTYPTTINELITAILAVDPLAQSLYAAGDSSSSASTWIDFGSIGQDMIQDAAIPLPVIANVAAFNNRPVWTCDGSMQWLLAAAVDSFPFHFTAGTIIIVGYYTSAEGASLPSFIDNGTYQLDKENAVPLIKTNQAGVTSKYDSINKDVPFIWVQCEGATTNSNGTDASLLKFNNHGEMSVSFASSAKGKTTLMGDNAGANKLEGGIAMVYQSSPAANLGIARAVERLCTNFYGLT